MPVWVFTAQVASTNGDLGELQACTGVCRSIIKDGGTGRLLQEWIFFGRCSLRLLNEKLVLEQYQMLSSCLLSLMG